MRPLNTINVTDAERQRRLDAVNYARVSLALEGFTLSAEEEHRAQAFVSGMITIAEFIAADGDRSLMRFSHTVSSG